LIIKDGFPKALRHYLVIPKSPDKTHIHPLLVFQNDPQFYEMIEQYVTKTKKLIMDDLFAAGLLKFDKTDTLATHEFMNRFIKAGSPFNPVPQQSTHTRHHTGFLFVSPKT